MLEKLEGEIVYILHKVENNMDKVYINKLEKLIENCELELAKENKKYISFNHIVEVYYYQYFIKDYEYECSPISINRLYKTLARINCKYGYKNKAIELYEKAIQYNPVDLEVFFELGDIYKTIGDLKKFIAYTKESYNYCCSRATLAKYYRNLGFYYLELYEPELSEKLYNYSNIYYETKNANSELIFLEKVLKRKQTKYSIEVLQNVLNKNGIAIKANPDTVGLTYIAAKDALKLGNLKAAKECYYMVYDLTNDCQIKRIINSI